VAGADVGPAGAAAPAAGAPPPPSRRSPPWLVPALVAVLLGLVGGWLGLAVLGTSDATIGPLDVTVRLDPLGGGGTTLALNPLGELAADTHRGPLGVELGVRAVAADEAEAILADPQRLTALREQLAGDVRAAAGTAVLRSVLVAVAGGGVLTLLVTRRPALAALGAVAALTLVVVPLAVAAGTVDTRALEQPRFSGLLSAAPDVVADVQKIAGNVDAYGEQLAAVVAHVTKLYDTGLALPTFAPREDAIRLLHVSDLHLNPAAWDVIRAVADQYDVDLIVDTGDISDQGSTIESRYVAPIGTLGRPYVFVRGNHDSPAVEDAVRRQRNAVVVDGTVQTVAGVRVLGVPDVRLTPDRAHRAGDAEQQRAAMAHLAELARAADPAVDVLLAHDPTDAEVVGGTAPLMLAGHGHQRHVRKYGDTLVLVQGSTGGAGLRALQGEEPTPVTLSVLYLDPRTKALQAWDDITLGGLGLTTATIQRVQADRAQPSESVPDVAEPSPTGKPAT
jgi:predicted MPP superfamily phosphohydrolase